MRRRHISAPRSDERSSIGDSHVDAAVGKLQKLAQTAATVMTEYKPAFHDTLRMLFADDTLDKMAQVKDMVDAASDVKGYDVGSDCTLWMNYQKANARVPAIEAKMVSLRHDLCQPLLTFVAEVKAVHDRFEEVKGVLRWLNRNATPGAIRFYWPTALTLCPQSPALMELQHVPSRYSNPPGIGGWMQALKDSAATMAGTAMLPTDVAPRPQNEMWLTFAKRVVHVDINGGHYSTDEMTYRI